MANNEVLERAEQLVEASHSEIPFATLAFSGNGIHGVYQQGNQPPEKHLQLIAAYIAWLEDHTDQDASTLGEEAGKIAADIGEGDDVLIEEVITDE
ncbi:hypothetical protein [Natrinema thermotolerans]